MDDVRFASLLCFRLCHDIIGPIGAINNGIEILSGEDDADMRAQTIDLMSYSAGEASNRVQFYRVAFGASGGGGVSLALPEARRVASAFFQTGKIDLDWPELPSPNPVTLDNNSTKLLFNLMLFGVEALPRGGTLAVSLVQGEAFTRLTVRAAGDRVGLADAFQRVLDRGATPEDLDARTVQAHLANRLADALGTQIAVASTARHVEIMVDARPLQ